MIKIKVIDLLIAIANGIEVPEKIKYENYIYWYDKNLKDYKNAQVDYRSYLISCKYHNTDFLNEEVEIVEDISKDKKIEDKARFQYSEIPSWLDIKEVIRVVNSNFERHQKALSEIIDEINGE